MKFDERNRYSYSGSDVAAYAFYPSDFVQQESMKAALPHLEAEIAAHEEQLAFYEQGTGEGINTPEISVPFQTEDDKRNALLTAAKIENLRQQQQYINANMYGSTPVHLESLATLSLSIHEPKGSARALGHKGVKGFSRSVRTIAGTMVLLIVEDHPLHKLIRNSRSRFNSDDAAWSLDHNSRGTTNYKDMGLSDHKTTLSTKIKPFSLYLVFRSEVMPPMARTATITFGDDPTVDYSPLTTTGDYDEFRTADRAADVARATSSIESGKSARKQYKSDVKEALNDPYGFAESISFKVPKIATLIIDGIEIISEGITSSVNDMVTEVVIQFMATDVQAFDTIRSSSELAFDVGEIPEDISDDLSTIIRASEENQTIAEQQKQERKKNSREMSQDIRSDRQNRRKRRTDRLGESATSDFTGSYEPN